MQHKPRKDHLTSPTLPFPHPATQPSPHPAPQPSPHPSPHPAHTQPLLQPLPSTCPACLALSNPTPPPTFGETIISASASRTHIGDCSTTIVTPRAREWTRWAEKIINYMFLLVCNTVSSLIIHMKNPKKVSCPVTLVSPPPAVQCRPSPPPSGGNRHLTPHTSHLPQGPLEASSYH